VVGEFGDEVNLVRSNQNTGAGANGNQIMDDVDDGALIHFIDADMDTETTETPTVARKLVARYSDRGVGSIRGLVSRVDGCQDHTTTVVRFSLWGNVTSGLSLIIYRLHRRRRNLLAHVRSR
jgi:hypothetical protein